MSYITAIGTANPAHRFRQEDIAGFMLRKMEVHNGEARKLKAIFKSSGIQFRHSVLEDYGREDNFSFYPNDNSSAHPSTAKRLEIFRDHAITLSSAAVKDLKTVRAFDAQEITHLIVVSCTGMYAPGLDIDLVRILGLNSSVQRTAINFMGCYAAFNALKLGDACCSAAPNAKVLIVCTELCSLHFQRNATEDNLLANALFADGSAAVLMENAPAGSVALKPEVFYSDLAFEGEQDMAWNVGDYGFEMRLSAYVPEIIRSGIATLTENLLSRLSCSVRDIGHFAIHPGGRRILEVIEQQLGLSKEDNRHAYRVLENFGNMSSATVLFVLNQIFRSLGVHNSGERVLSFAFGPGLTLESMLLKIEHPNA